MDLLTDPSMKEIVDGFIEESKGLFSELEDILDDLEDDPINPPLFEKYGQVIDRVMGAAKAVGANKIAMFCELGKIIGYKASQSETASLLEVVVAVQFDSVDLLKKMILNLEQGKGETLEGISTEAFGTRLHWLSDKFKHINRSSVGFEEGEDAGETGSGSDDSDSDTLEQDSIDDLLADLGL